MEVQYQVGGWVKGGGAAGPGGWVTGGWAAVPGGWVQGGGDGGAAGDACLPASIDAHSTTYQRKRPLPSPAPCPSPQMLELDWPREVLRLGSCREVKAPDGTLVYRQAGVGGGGWGGRVEAPRVMHAGGRSSVAHCARCTFAIHVTCIWRSAPDAV